MCKHAIGCFNFKPHPLPPLQMAKFLLKILSLRELRTVPIYEFKGTFARFTEHAGKADLEIQKESWG